MKPPPFRYERAESLEHAIELLEQHGDEAKPLAGGQSLVALMNLRLARPGVLVDIGRLGELRGVTTSDDHVAVGALTTQAQVESHSGATASVPLLREALPHLAHPPIRARGTVGGSIAHADPAGELPLVLAALDGSVVARSRRGERVIAQEDFFLGFLQTALEPDEILTEVRFPIARAGSGHAFEEFSRRQGDFAVVAVAAVVDGEGSARVAVGGVAATPIVVDGGGLPSVGSASGLDALIEAVQSAIDPSDDVHGSAAYRRALTSELVQRAVRRAGGKERSNGTE